MRVALVNTNRMQPPIAPIGLDYAAEALGAAGHVVDLLDLCWEDDPPAAIAAFFGLAEYGLVGVTLRNTDDCGFTSRQSFLPEFVETVAAIRRHTAAPIVLGGVGFSVMPEQVLALAAADAGVWGEGEFALPALAARIESGAEWRDLPNLIWRRGGAWHRNPAAAWPLAALPPMSRRRVDNVRYFRAGGQAGREGRRQGCWSREEARREGRRSQEGGEDHSRTGHSAGACGQHAGVKTVSGFQQLLQHLGRLAWHVIPLMAGLYRHAQRRGRPPHLVPEQPEANRVGNLEFRVGAEAAADRRRGNVHERRGKFDVFCQSIAYDGAVAVY